jgi:spermidine/putrescine transport system permease protein
MKAQPKPKNAQGPLDYGSRTWLKVLFASIFFVLYAPIITLIAFSFNTDKRGIVWRGFTLDNYVKAWNNASLIEALTNSLVIALIATLIATVLGALAALLLWRFRFPMRGGYEGFMALPIVIPEICMGVALLLFFVNSGMMAFFVNMPWPLNLGNIIIAHVSFCFPFVAVAPHRLQPAARGGLEGSGRQRMADILVDHRALHEAGPHRGRTPRLHALAR